MSYVTVVRVSTLGLSGRTESSDGLWKGLFWPTIQNAQDADLASTRGFWICFALAFVSGAAGSTHATISVGIDLESCMDWAVFFFYFLGATGVRQGSLTAAGAMFANYLLGTVLYFRLSPFHFSFLRLIGLALLLTNLRAVLLVRKWQKNPSLEDDAAYEPTRLKVTLRDKLVDQMPTRVWPWGRAVFYALAAILIPLECVGIARLLFHPS